MATRGAPACCMLASTCTSPESTASHFPMQPGPPPDYRSNNTFTANNPQQPAEIPLHDDTTPSHGESRPTYSRACDTCGEWVSDSKRHRNLPPHMKLDEWPGPFSIPLLLTAIFTSLCTICYGHKDLTHVWCTSTSTEKAEKEWVVRKDRLAVRINNVTVVVRHLIVCCFPCTEGT